MPQSGIKSRRRIMDSLTPSEKADAAKALRCLEAVNTIQLEVTSDFKIQPGRKILVLALPEILTNVSISRSLTYFEEVHLIIPRTVTEDRTGKALSSFMTRLEEITANASKPFETIELWGYLDFSGVGCGCELARMLR